MCNRANKKVTTFFFFIKKIIYVEVDKEKKKSN